MSFAARFSQCAPAEREQHQHALPAMPFGDEYGSLPACGFAYGPRSQPGCPVCRLHELPQHPNPRLKRERTILQIRREGAMTLICLYWTPDEAVSRPFLLRVAGGIGFAFLLLASVGAAAQDPKPISAGRLYDPSDCRSGRTYCRTVGKHSDVRHIGQYTVRTACSRANAGNARDAGNETSVFRYAFTQLVTVLGRSDQLCHPPHVEREALRFSESLPARSPIL